MPGFDRPTPNEGYLLSTLSARIQALENVVNRHTSTVSAFQGSPPNATMSVPHNDSWLFEDNVDSTHAANLRYIIPANTQRIVSARLSLHLAPYRTYNSFTLSSTGVNAAAESGHTHSHGHTWPVGGGAGSFTLNWDGAGNVGNSGGAGSAGNVTATTNAAGSSGHSHSHSHTVSGSSTLGVTEGATATGVTVAFDGVDHTADIGGPFNADAVELDVHPYLGTTLGTWHVISMQPSGLGRIEAHLRLGVYVSAGQVP
jgi:hypothetical protein